ncbi:MAG: hypothetical protein IPP51_01545 [Bacteroidetes bacterium]|nr:hypothetical protein [Bacteroidota bacterium]
MERSSGSMDDGKQLIYYRKISHDTNRKRNSNGTKISRTYFQLPEQFQQLQKLMPEQVTNWQSTEEECSFTISGMASLGMKILRKTPNSLIKVAKNGKAPFDFTLDCMIKEAGADACQVQLAFDADLNPMLKMMAVKPLTNFLNLLVNRLGQIV